MIPVTNLRQGTYFTDGKDIFQVLSYEHVKLGRGTANIKLKTKNLKTGSITEKTFISGAKVEEVMLERRETQYLYKPRISPRLERGDRLSSGEGVPAFKAQSFIFMNPKTFEQFELSEDKIGKAASFLKEGIIVKILFYKEEPLTIELPIKMEFIVAETGPEIRGDSATNIFKEAILENGLKIKVPLFVKIGDRVLVDTRTGEYQERITR